eukprot:Sspe_Gene.81979::Locus_53379_Transcript_1_1_Confidence_1.000_Length_887::g.81979::m.81979
MPYVELDSFRIAGRQNQTDYVLQSAEYKVLLANNIVPPTAPDVMQPISKKEWLAQLRGWEAEIKKTAARMTTPPAVPMPQHSTPPPQVPVQANFLHHRPGLPLFIAPMCIPMGVSLPPSPLGRASRCSSNLSSFASTPGYDDHLSRADWETSPSTIATRWQVPLRAKHCDDAASAPVTPTTGQVPKSSAIACTAPPSPTQSQAPAPSESSFDAASVSTEDTDINEPSRILRMLRQRRLLSEDDVLSECSSE